MSHLDKFEFQPERLIEEMYYSFFGADGDIANDVDPETRFYLEYVQFHVDSAFRGANPLAMYISSVLGSAYNFTLYSANISGSTDIRFSYPCRMRLLSGDQLVINLSMASGANAVGLTVGGWAVRG